MTRRWVSDGVTLPHEVEEAFWNDRLVFFCGAGVSSAEPSKLPSFRGLAEDVARTLGHPELVPKDPGVPVQFDVVMGQLHEMSKDVHQRVSSRLEPTVTPNSYHLDIWRIAAAKGKTPRIVTTNFDLLFEAAAKALGLDPKIHVAPSLPLGYDFSGLVHLHGVQSPPKTTRMVLTDRDFGQAYITEGWATQFLTSLFAHNTVVLIGYSAEDTIIQYLNRALPSNGERFAFTRDTDEYPLWGRLGIKPIPFPSLPDDPYGALERFVSSWQRRLTSTPTHRFDQIVEFIEHGTEAAERESLETSWKLNDPELARHFRSKARATDWLKSLDRMGILNSLFDSEGEEASEVREWSQWVCASIDADDGEALLIVLARHEGKLHSNLWFQIWHKMLNDFNGSTLHRQLVFVLAASHQPDESERLSMLLNRTVETDPATAEVLLRHMLNPQLRLKVQSGWSFGEDYLEIRQRLWWRPSSMRDAWSKLMPQLSDRSHLLSVVLDLIRTVEKTDAFFTGSEREDAISARRNQVEQADRYRHDDPYALVVDIARDLLRESVRTHGTREAIRYVDDRSEMNRRLAIDALAEARSTEADSLIKLLIQQELPFTYRSRPEVFRLMDAAYKNASASMRQALLEHIQEATHTEHDTEIRDYDRYNVFVWLSKRSAEDDPVQTLRYEFEREQGYEPDESPNLTSVLRISSVPDTPYEVVSRFRGLPVNDLVCQLSNDQTLNDEFGDGSTLRELQDYLVHTPEAHLPLLDEMIAQKYWSPLVWRTILQDLVSGTIWVANDLRQRLLANADNSSRIAPRLGFAIAYPNNELKPSLNNEQERTRLLLGLWQIAVHESGGEATTDPSNAMATDRGSLAHYYTETVLRIAQQEGENGRVPPENIEGLQQILDAQVENPADPSPMMLSEYASHLQFRAPEWFETQLLPRLAAASPTPHWGTLWAGILARQFPSFPLREVLREQIRTFWPRVSTSLPGSTESFIQLHAICFAFHFGSSEPEWADAFLTQASASQRVRWIRAVAHYLDQEGEVAQFQELILDHWNHRLEGQPPITEAEQRAFVRWLTLPGIDIAKASELFVSGPEVAARDDDLYDYYDLEGFPHEEYPLHYVRVATHLMQKNVSPPPFVGQLIAAADKIATTDRPLAERALSALLRLGYSPARRHLEQLNTRA